MATNKDVLMQPLSDDELADVNGGIGGSQSCISQCEHLKGSNNSGYMKCLQACSKGGNMASFR